MNLKSLQADPSGQVFAITKTSLDDVNPSNSTKQALNSSTGLLVIAGDDTTHYYWHNTLTLGSGGPTPTPTSTSAATPTSTHTWTPAATAMPTQTPAGSPTPSNTPLPTDTPTPTATPGSQTFFNDGFESGNFAAWSLVQTDGDAAQLSERATSGSKAYARKSLATSQTDLTVRGGLQT